MQEIDKKPTQILIEAKILEVSLTDDDSYSLDWTKFFSARDGEGEFGLQGLSNPSSPGLFSSASRTTTSRRCSTP